MQQVPSDTYLMDARRALEEEEDDQSFDAPRVGAARADAQIDDDAEFYDDEKDNDGEEVPEDEEQPQAVPKSVTGLLDVETTSGPAPRRSIMQVAEDKPVLGKRPVSALDNDDPVAVMDTEDKGTRPRTRQ